MYSKKDSLEEKLRREIPFFPFDGLPRLSERHSHKPISEEHSHKPIPSVGEDCYICAQCGKVVARPAGDLRAYPDMPYRKREKVGIWAGLLAFIFGSE